MGKSINFTEESCLKVIEFRDGGMSLSEIGSYFGISTWKVVDILKSYGLETGRKEFTKEQINKMRNMYESGRSLKDIAKVFSISRPTLSEIFKKERIEINRSGRIKSRIDKYKFSENEYREMISLYESGESFKKIGRIFGVSWGVIEDRLRRKGVNIVNRNLKRDYTGEEYLEVENLYKVFKSTNKVGEKLGISYSVVNKILKRRGVSLERKLERNKQVCENIISNYRSGKTLMEVGAEVGVSSYFCREVLFENSVDIRNKGRMLVEGTISEDEIKYIEDMYLSGFSVTRIAKFTKHGIDSCKRILRNGGIAIKEDARRYNLNKKYFSEIDSEEKAYWIGFMMADAGVRKNLQGVGITLQKRDRGHLEKFRDCLDSDYSVVDFMDNRTYKHYSRIGVFSIDMIQDLLKVGVTPRKSFTATPPCLSNDLMRHFWRGAVDGDGWVSIGKQYVTGLCGSKNMLDGYLAFIKDSGIKTKATVRKSKNIYVTVFGGRLIAKKVTDLLYKDSVMYLDRKYENYKRLCKTFTD